MDAEVQEFYEDIVACLVKYGNLEKEAAIRLVKTSNLKELDEMLFHEPPYYWAMHLLHAKTNPKWYLDPKLWPPPQEHLDKWYLGKE